MNLTGATITNEQILVLRAALHDEARQLDGEAWIENHEQSHACAVALGFRASPRPGYKREARTRCAEILNARSKQP